MGIKTMKDRVRKDLKFMVDLMQSMRFLRAALVASSVAFPIILGVILNQLDIGIAIAFGAFFVSPADVSGSKKHTRNGVLAATVLVTLIAFIANMLPDNLWISIPVIGLLLFLTSMISVFGFRGSMIGYAGVLTLTLSYAAVSKMDPVTHTAYIGIGGLWYMFLARMFYYLFPKGPIDEALNDVLNLTSKFIRTRVKLIEPNTDRTALRSELFDYQFHLNESHEKLRALLLSERQAFGKSGYKRNRMLIFIQMVNIYELAMANPVNYEKMEKLYNQYPSVYYSFRALMRGMSRQLDLLAEARHLDTLEIIDLRSLLAEVRNEIRNYKTQSFATPEGTLALTNFYRYQEKQVDNVEQLVWIAKGNETEKYQMLTESQAFKFITPEEYNLQVVKDHLNLDSVIFRHSLRLAVVGVLCVWVGEWLKVQNAYWILLTAVLILRPNYGLTKERALARTLGTVIGALVALAVIFFIHNPYVYAVLGFIAMVFGLSLVRENYRISSAFITLNIVFVYALLTPDLWDVIQYRVLDTMIGAGLATFGNIFLWPSWEIKNFDKVLERSLLANKAFFNEIVDFYSSDLPKPNSYNLARKEAFLAVSDLSATFQRMAQEPKSQRVYLETIYELTTLNHAFLSALASTSTFIQNQPTTSPSREFLLAAKNINMQLDKCIGEMSDVNVSPIRKEELSAYLTHRDTTEFMVFTQGKENYDSHDYERYLIIEQLKWLFNLSEEIHKKIVRIKQQMLKNDN